MDVTVLWLLMSVLLASALALPLALNQPFLWKQAAEMIANMRDQSFTLGKAVITQVIVGHALFAAVISWGWNLRVAAITMALVGLVWSRLAYFRYQRFAGLGSQPMLYNIHPWLLPFATLIGLTMGVVSSLVFAPWYVAIVPGLLWVALGYGGAELAIRRVLKEATAAGQPCSRESAIIAVNAHQGRGVLAGGRYPYP